MALPRKKKDNPRLHSQDIYRFIARQSSLTAEQVQECFDVYCKLIKGIVATEVKSENLEIPLPKLGSFIFKVHKGRKKGTTYRVPIATRSSTFKEVVLEEDEPDYDRLTFKVRTTIQNELKQISKEKRIKEKKFNSLNLENKKDKDKENE